MISPGNLRWQFALILEARNVSGTEAWNHEGALGGGSVREGKISFVRCR